MAKKWNEYNVFEYDKNSNKQKYFTLEMWPYPSGNLHMGHVLNFTLVDVNARYKVNKGYNLLRTFGWDAFGLPAENAAIERNIHPKKWTMENIDRMKNQVLKMGMAMDWKRETTTCLPEYYKHQQKIFLDFYKNKLAYRSESWVNWDPIDQTVLANEQVVDGKGWRSGAPVERKKMSQWFFAITKYADKLLNNIEKLPLWPDKIKTMQKNWIGKSEGVMFKWKVFKGMNDTHIHDEHCDHSHDILYEVDTFTTRIETIFGATAVCLSPDHRITQDLSKINHRIQEFLKKCEKIKMQDGLADRGQEEKIRFDTGLFCEIDIGDYSIRVPLTIDNYVLSEYGTGAIFSCPAHDERDFEVAVKYNTPIVQVISNDRDVIIETENFYLKPFVEENIEDVYDLYQDFWINRERDDFHNAREYTKEEVRKKSKDI